MGKDISTEYTKDQNKTRGRKGYTQFKREKTTIIPPDQYGMFLSKKYNSNRRNSK